jgi:hypothetical protein
MSEELPPRDHGHEPVRKRDLIELVLEPLASQVDQARLQLLEKLKNLDDSIEMIAREVSRTARP